MLYFYLGYIIVSPMVTSPATVVLAGSCQNSGPIGREIAKELDLPFAAVVCRPFPDSELYVRLPVTDDGRSFITDKGLVPVQDSHIYYVQTTAPSQSEHLIEMFLTLHKLSDYAQKVDLVIPYLAHSRQDQEFKKGEAVSVDAIGQILNCFNVNYLFTIDVHFNRSIGLFNRFKTTECPNSNDYVKGYNISASPYLAEYIKSKLHIKNALIVIPDEGHKIIMDAIKEVWGNEVIYLTKNRINEREVIIKGEKINLKNKNIIIIDDMISTGTTALKTVEWLKKLGAENFTVACTHALYLEHAYEKLKNAGVKHFVSTDTIMPEDKNVPKAVVPVAPILVKAIKEVYSDKEMIISA